jgi:hypothetical protein
MTKGKWPPLNSIKPSPASRKVKIKWALCENCNKPAMTNIEMQARKLKPIYMATKQLNFCLKCHIETTNTLKSTSGFANGKQANL